MMKDRDNNSSIITVKNISKSFTVPHEKITTLRGMFTNMFKKKSSDTLIALDNVSFDVKSGEFLGIIGRNGSGKSTLLKILAGVYTSDSGTVDVEGAIAPFLELGIGFNPELSGRDNIYLNATVLGLSKEEIDEKFDDIVEFSEIGRFIDQKLKNYSSGMNMRLAFSVAIHTNRDILLMDEVLAVGDLNFQSKCIAEFMKHRALGRTIIFVTHDIASVQKYCDRAILLRDGVLEKIGLPKDVCNVYIENNMQDEQVRIIKERAQKKKEEVVVDQQYKKVEILDAEFISENGEVQDVFQTGESFSIRITYKVNQPAEVLNIGVGVHSITEGQIFGYNTQMDEYEIDQQKGVITLRMVKPAILKGDYYLNVVCFGEIEQEYYDVKPHYKNMKIYTPGHKYRYRGFFDIEHTWQEEE